MIDLDYQNIIEKDLFDILGAKNMPENQKRDILTKALETVQNRVIARISDKLSEAEVDEWKKILETGNQQEAQKYMLSKDVDVPALLAQETIIYKTELAELMRQ